MKRILIAISMFLAANAAMNAQQTPLWLRSNSISPDGTQIAFTYKGNIYITDTLFKHLNSDEMLTFVIAHEMAHYKNRDHLMNLRKSNGSRNSGDRQFVKYAKADNELLNRQFNLINPDIVIYGYTFDAAKGIHNLSSTKKEYPSSHWYYIDQNNRVHIDYFHPANRYPALLQYYGLMGIYKKSLGEDK